MNRTLISIPTPRLSQNNDILLKIISSYFLFILQRMPRIITTFTLTMDGSRREAMQFTVGFEIVSLQTGAKQIVSSDWTKLRVWNDNNNKRNQLNRALREARLGTFLHRTQKNWKNQLWSVFLTTQTLVSSMFAAASKLLMSMRIICPCCKMRIENLESSRNSFNSAKLYLNDF